MIRKKWLLIIKNKWETFNENKFHQKITLIFIAFVFSGLLGSVISYSFQNRSWKYQYKVSLQRSETKTSLKIFEEVSKLADERIYRMEKLNWALENNSDQEKIKQQMDLYRAILYKWNDNYNRNRALTTIYFGSNIERYFSKDIHSAIKKTGEMLEKYYYTPANKRNIETGYEIDGRIGDLENKAYELNLRMLNVIRKQEANILNEL